MRILPALLVISILGGCRSDELPPDQLRKEIDACTKNGFSAVLELEGPSCNGRIIHVHCTTEPVVKDNCKP